MGWEWGGWGHQVWVGFVLDNDGGNAGFLQNGSVGAFIWPGELENKLRHLWSYVSRAFNCLLYAVQHYGPYSKAGSTTAFCPARGL